MTGVPALGPTCDVLVAGAGPAGSAAATLFAQAGYDVRLLDRARFPRFKPCGEFLSPEATGILARLGVEEAVRSAGARRLRGLLVSAYGEPALRADFDPGDRGFGYALERSRLDAILLERARSAGAQVYEAWRVERLRAPEEANEARRAVLVRSPDGDEVVWQARLIVGAGGKRCAVARDLGVQRRPAGEGRVDFLAHWGPAAGASPTVTRELSSSQEAFARRAYCEMHVAAPGYTGLASVGPDILNVNTVVPRSWLRHRVRAAAVRGSERSDRAGGAGAPQALRARLYDSLIRSSVPVARALEGGTPLYPPVASDVTPLSTVRASAAGVLLAGDAALFIDPFTGQGIYLALRSAELAFEVGAGALAAGDTRADRLAAYDGLRRREFAPKVALSRLLQTILYRPALARRVVAALRRDRRSAALLVGAIGDYRPPTELLHPGFIHRLMLAAVA